MERLLVENKKVGKGCPVFIVAEAGINHKGSLRIAKKMVDIAKSSGADAVKFQTFRTEDLVTKNVPKAEYQKKTVRAKTQFTMLKGLELGEAKFRELFKYCRVRGIMFLSSPFDSRSAEFLYNLGVPAFKVGSGELTNIPLLRQIAKYKRPIILSTGMSELLEVKEAIQTIYSSGNKKLVLLHCTSNYPARYEDVNLKALDTLRKEFNTLVGYSDHSVGIEASVAAAARGACVIEKHFTLDRDFSGPDHKSSLEPDELREMIMSIRNIEKAIGDGVKAPRKSEIEIRKIARKSVVAACDIKKGTTIKEHMLAIKRPGIGIEPKYFGRLIGKKSQKAIKKDQLFTWNMVR